MGSKIENPVCCYCICIDAWCFSFLFFAFLFFFPLLFFDVHVSTTIKFSDARLQANDAARAVQRDADSASTYERKTRLQVKQLVGQVMKKLDVAMVQLEKTLRTPGVNLMAEGSTKALLEMKKRVD